MTRRTRRTEDGWGNLKCGKKDGEQQTIEGGAQHSEREHETLMNRCSIARTSHEFHDVVVSNADRRNIGVSC